MLGQAIKLLRKEKGIGQEELGEIVGVTGSAISRYESGKRDPDSDTLALIAEALDSTVAELRTIGREFEVGRPMITLPSAGDCRFVTSDETMSAWMGMVTVSQELTQGEKLLLLMLPQFIDRISWVVAIDPATLADLVGLELDMVEHHWPQILSSPFTDLVGYTNTTIRLAFPK